jgi:hypothetical protein
MIRTAVIAIAMGLAIVAVFAFLLVSLAKH